jgi:glutaryl-CoA dehydrogenase
MTLAGLDPLDLFDLESLLSEDEKLVRDSVARFVDQEVLPIIGRCFAEHRFPAELVPQLAGLGVLGATLGEHGGAGLNYVAYGLICQELERGDSSLRSFVSVQSSLVIGAIAAYGSDEQKHRWLPAMIRGDAIGAFALTEPQGGSDPASMKTRARRDGSDWILDGQKAWITNGALADVVIVWAQADEGVRAFLVERGIPGFAAREIHDKLSLRASHTAELFLSDVRLPEAARLPEVRGLGAALSCLDQARYGIAWGAVGAASACFEESLDYTATRELFGRPLAQTQLIQVRLADCARRLSAAQLLAHRLGMLKDEGKAGSAQVSVAKWNNVRMALDVARDCRDMLGGAGITTEHATMRHMLNLESVVTYEGTESVHQLLIGRALTGVSAF